MNSALKAMETPSKIDNGWPFFHCSVEVSAIANTLALYVSITAHSGGLAWLESWTSSRTVWITR